VDDSQRSVCDYFSILPRKKEWDLTEIFHDVQQEEQNITFLDAK
jgi:hypothetical protein